MRQGALTAALLAGLLAWQPTELHAADYCHTCARDSHGRIARSAAAIRQFKQLNPCPATLESRGRCPGYVIDHIKALKRGGADKPCNMQWQTVAAARAKDRWE